MPNPYGPTLIEHFRHPRNKGSLADPTIVQEGSNPLCGDRVRIELRLESGVVREARFTANACAICVASASVLTELVASAPLDEVDTLTVDDLVRALQAEIPASRLNCIRLPLTVLHTGVLLYRREHHLPDAEHARPVAAVVLAAGQARRFGAQKLVAPFGSSTVIRTVVDTLAGCAIDYLMVVVGPTADAIRGALAGAPVSWAVNENPASGMSSSIVTGVNALPPNVGAALIVLGDQPTLSPAVVNHLVATWRAGSTPIVAPSYRGERGNPVLFDRMIFAQLSTLTGDRGARELIRANPMQVALVEVAEAAPMDLDTPADYHDLLRSRAARRR